ncbi:DUF1801 domain-containing protein [Deinococcus aquiradiocola]|uniref:YdhG-like domain-containing protein n=1 Tax=Deinococcus aquiradiocola TaxID=393059 RepID=A0A917UMJ8_9DEIO|nr:DUF1801 domain-containing protein [Deinococcus aquiradiocola]GGJ68297.1 hypothetical protein GCM10008939_10880 [Deinococcus aquiradiocola]
MTRNDLPGQDSQILHPEENQPVTASERIDARIADLGDWRGETLAAVRALIRRALPDVQEEWKWGVPVWSQSGVLCTGETYRSAVKLTFAHGASLPDPTGLFNASLEGRVRRAIDLPQGALQDGQLPDADAFMALMQHAAAHNLSRRPVRAARPNR